ncbi:MAG: type III-B CRISPR module-associated Cmr3 family protein, partial [Chloroflexota bacterium]
MTDQMRTQWLFIQAQDVWMFRDSKPFAAAQSFVARSIFPPTPQTMQGAIRTAYLEQRGGRWSEYANGRIDTETSAAIGLPARKDTAASFGTLELDGPYIARKKEDGAITRLVQMPLDVLYNKDKHQYVSLMPDQDPGFVSNAVEGWTPLVSTPQAGDCEEATGWLDDDEFAHYLKGNVPQTVVKQAEIYGYDERVGLALDYSKRVNQPSMFYHAHFIRPAEDIGLLVGLKNATL